MLPIGSDFNTGWLCCRDPCRLKTWGIGWMLETGRKGNSQEAESQTDDPKSNSRLSSGAQPTPDKPPPADLPPPACSTVFKAVLLLESYCCCVHDTDPIDLSHQVPTETCSKPVATKYCCLSPDESRPNAIRLPADVLQPFRSGCDSTDSNHDCSRSPLADCLLR